MPASDHRGLAALLAIPIALLLIGCGSGGPNADSATLEPLGALETGGPLPRAELPALEGDASLDTADLVGRPAVINFWASWCAFCVDEMPDFEAVHGDLGEQVRFVGVNKEDQLDKARTLAAETGVTFELVRDDDASFFRAVQGRGMPTTLFVDAAGTVAYRHAGPLDEEALRELVEEHLGVR
jgi:cytochrome c biogenesis protein CcmG, thiol:disulfide interchange protein DsbE